MNASLIADMPEDAYHADVSRVGSSMIKDALNSPELYEAKYVLGTIKDKDSDALRLGRATDMAIFEPRRFRDNFVLEPTFEHNGKSKSLAQAKNIKALTYEAEEFEASARGKTILSAAQWSEIDDFIHCLRSNPEAESLLFTGAKFQQTIFWTENGVDLKARLDAVDFDTDIIADLKTTKEVGEDARNRQAFNLGYHLSAAHYCAGYQALTGRTPRFIIVWLCKPLRRVFLREMIGRPIEIGEWERQRGLTLIREKAWSKPDRLRPVIYPQWAENKMKEELGL